MMMTLLLVVAGVNAQKIDQRLTRLVEKSDTRSGNNRITQSPQAVKQQIAVEFNADGTPCSMSAIATLKKGEECPTRQLEQMGIEVRYQIGDMVVLNVPADKLLQLEQVEAFSYIRADEMMSKINEKAREATNVEKVNNAAAAAAQQLPKAYTGEGVVIGVIDAGIDYITRNTWKDYTNTDRNYLVSGVTGKVQEIGEISDFSSYCVDDNGKARPTLIAPGMGLLSGASNYAEDLFKEGAPGVVNPEKDLTYLCSCVEKFDRKNWYEIEQGTSMSTPVVTGIVALWMQAKPTLSVNDILAVMQKTCVNDEFTTNVAKIPSGNKVQAGLGKIDCLAGLKEILGTTDIETISMDGHREATPATMYSVDAPVYNMMGQRVNKNTRGLVIYKGRKYVNK